MNEKSDIDNKIQKVRDQHATFVNSFAAVQENLEKVRRYEHTDPYDDILITNVQEEQMQEKKELVEEMAQMKKDLQSKKNVKELLRDMFMEAMYT